MDLRALQAFIIIIIIIIWIPMLWVYLFLLLQWGVDFGRQNLTSTDVRFCRLKSIPAL